MKRHNSRILAMMTLYQNDLIEHSKMKDILEEDLIKDSATFKDIEDLEIDENFYTELVNGVKEHKAEIDEIISKNLVKWTLDRLSFVDRAIIEVATYEMKYTKTPMNIIIDEAVSITFDYVDTDDFPAKRFNNKVLDNIKDYLNGKN